MASKWILHGLFIVLIVTGILMKRVFDHPEWLPPFHIAALFVLIGISFTRERKHGNREADSDGGVIAFALFFSAAAFAPSAAFAKGPIPVLHAAEQQQVLELGRELYARHCSGCHGEKGDGQGPATPWLAPKPRDFTRGLFKFRTTPAGSLPSEDDLFRTISEGVYGTSMPPWRGLPELERRALVKYVQTFHEGFEDEAAKETPLAIPHPPDDLASPERVKLGRTAFRVLGCQQCHGKTGGGDGPSSGEMKDDWGQPIVPANFHRGVLRGGRAPRDIFRAVATGFSGTPMPAFGTAIPEDKMWGIVSYIRFLAKKHGDPDADSVVAECEVWDNCSTEPDTRGRN